MQKARRMQGGPIKIYRPPRYKYKNRRYGRGHLRVSGYYGGVAGQEKKFHDGNGLFQTISTTGEISTSMVLIAQGSGESQRIGRKIKLTSMSIRFTILLPNTATTTDTSDIVRLIVVHDKQANGANAAWLDVFESTGWDSYRNLANLGRFNVMLDKRITIHGSMSGNGTTSRMAQGSIHWGWHKKLNMVIEYDSTAGAITEIKSNNLLFMFQSRFGTVDVFEKRRMRFIG